MKVTHKEQIFPEIKVHLSLGFVTLQHCFVFPEIISVTFLFFIYLLGKVCGTLHGYSQSFYQVCNMLKIINDKYFLKHYIFH